EIDLVELGLGAEPLQLDQCVGALGLVAAGNGDLGTLFGEAPRDAAADARIAARDDGNLVLEPHESPLTPSAYLSARSQCRGGSPPPAQAAWPCRCSHGCPPSRASSQGARRWP